INVTKKDTLGVRIDQSGKFSSMTLLRAMDPAYSSNADIIKAFYQTEVIKTTKENRDKIKGSIAVGDVIDPETGEVYLESCAIFTEEALDRIYASGLVKEVDVLSAAQEKKESLILKSLDEDPTNTHEEALLKIYQRLRPG